jgi:hypothetical protein
MKKFMAFLLLAGCLIPTSSQAQSLVGTWGYGYLNHTNAGAWYTEQGKTVFRNNGTGTINFNFNNNGTMGSEIADFQYSVLPMSDGSQYLTLTFQSPSTLGPRYNKLFFSDDGNMGVTDGTNDLGRQGFGISVRLDPVKQYTNGDFSGSYYGIGYHYNASQNAYIAISSLANSDGNMGLSYTHTVNSNGTIMTPSEFSPYTVSSDGLIDTNSVDGYLSGDGKMSVLSYTDTASKFSSHFIMKKGDKVGGYSTADLAGTWIVVGFGDNSTTSFSAALGSLSCDGSGNCFLKGKSQRDGQVTFGSEITPHIVVSPDGSFGGSINPGSPDYAGAIGNNGNSILFNLSFNPSELFFRQIFVGVRCSTCTFPLEIYLPLILKM